jgi:hypothetical protein
MGLAPFLLMDGKILSQIRILDSDQIQLFEWRQPAAEALDVDLASIRTVHHPFPVTQLPDGGYLLLAESGYFRAMQEAGLGQFPVQVCHPDSLRIQSESFGLDVFAFEDLVRLAAKHPDRIMIREDRQERPEPLGFRKAEFKFSPSRKVQVYLRDSSKTGCPTSLKNLFRAIAQGGRYLSLVDHFADSDSLTRMAVLTATVDLPTFTLHDIIAAASSDRTFPPGLIRVKTNRRILDIDYPMSVLVSDISASEKEAFFRDMMVLRQQSRKTVVYDGQVVLLNQQMFS